MNIRYFSIIILFLSVLSASADKKMTIRNSDTGESFEVSVPEGIRIYEYNSNWLDSIPYLLERARYGEPWAYEALGDCYRYGKGGVERSIFKTFFYYELAGMDIERKAVESLEENPTDQLGNTFRLIDMMEKGNMESVMCFLDTAHYDNHTDAYVIRDLICEADSNARSQMVEHNIMSPDVSTDKTMFTVFGCFAMNWFPETFKAKSDIVTAVGDKLPCMYDKIAVDFFSKGHEDMDPDTIARKTATAFTFLEKADNAAMLSHEGAEILYRHYQSEHEAGRMKPDVENMERLAILARLPESETFIFTDK